MIEQTVHQETAESNIPTLDAWRIRGTEPWPFGCDQLICWCKFCKHYHWHGGGETGSPAKSADGHRVCHCDNGSPYHKHGYILREVGIAPEAIRKDANRRRPRGPEKAVEEKAS